MSPCDLPTTWLKPEWPVASQVVAFTTSRLAPDTMPDSKLSSYQDFNLALHVNDNEQTVRHNRTVLASHCALNAENIHWLEQIHSNTLVQAESSSISTQADASYTRKQQEACVVMTADCLPVLFCNEQATQVAAAHAGWRGLASGILTKTVESFDSPNEVIAWLGPAISQKAFEVGDDVYTAFCNKDPEAAQAFIPGKEPGKWLADLYLLARIELKAIGVSAIYGGTHCTFLENQHFYSFRRDGQVSGRMASLIFLR